MSRAVYDNEDDKRMKRVESHHYCFEHLVRQRVFTLFTSHIPATWSS
jgi:hypothetical protein